MSKCKSKARFSVANDTRKRKREREREKEKAAVRNLMRDIFVVVIEAKSATHIHTQQVLQKEKIQKKYTRKQSER